MKKKKKRTNPNRVPSTKQEALKKGRDQGVDLAMAIIFQAALDSGLLEPKDLKEVLWPKVEYLSDSICQGRVNAHDMMRCLREEYGVLL